jgi:Arc/MetJ family transcription regulator
MVEIKASIVIGFDAMRTTLTLDDDVAAELERLRRIERKRFKTVVNEALRRGLRQDGLGAAQGAKLRTRSVSLGEFKLGSVDNVAEVLSGLEGKGPK